MKASGIRQKWIVQTGGPNEMYNISGVEGHVVGTAGGAGYWAVHVSNYAHVIN